MSSSINCAKGLDCSCDRLNLLKQSLGQWQKDLEIFRELITQRFLERQVQVFPSNINLPPGPQAGL